MTSVRHPRKKQPTGSPPPGQFVAPTRLPALVTLLLVLLATTLYVNRASLYRTYCRLLPLPWLQAQSRGPEDAVGGMVLAERYLRVGRPSEAEALLGSILDRHPELWESWLLRSRAEMAQSKFGPAYASLQVARSGLPPRAETHFLMGQLQERRGDENRAEREYREAIKLDPRHLGARLRLGRFELVHLHYGAALDHLKAARSVAPDNLEVIQLLAQAHQFSEQPAEAEALMREAIRMKPDAGRSWFVLGDLLKSDRSPQRRAEAEAAFRRSVALDPALVLAHHEIGALRFQAGDFAAAATHFEAVLRDLPLHKQSYPMLAQSYLRCGRGRDARQTLKEYARLDAMDLDTAPLEYSLWAMPEDVALRLKLARLYLKYGRKDLAESQAALALEANPRHPGAMRLRDELRRTP